MAVPCEVCFKRYGEEMQFVEMILNKNERVVAKPGTIMYKDGQIGMETLFGAGSEKSYQKDSRDHLRGTVESFFIGEGLSMIMFTNPACEKASIAFSASYPGRIIPIDLAEYGGCLNCQKDTFLCAAKVSSFKAYLLKKTGESYSEDKDDIMLSLEGNGVIFLHAAGTGIKKNLQAGQSLELETSCLVAMTSGIAYSFRLAKNNHPGIYGGSGLALATLKGPGSIWLQSISFSRMADRISKAACGGNKEQTKGIHNPFEGISELAHLFDRDQT